MKKSVFVLLLALTSTSFAKGFDPNLLVGTWQCKTDFNYPTTHFQGQENSGVTYNKDHTYHQTSVVKGTLNEQKNLTKVTLDGRWKLKNDIFSNNIENITDYRVSNPMLENAEKMKQDLLADKSFVDYRILQLSKNKWVQTLAKTDEFEEQATLMDTCQRMN